MNVLEHLSAAITGAMNLRIITEVGDAAVTGSLENPSVAMPSTGSTIVTNIDLAQGDITTVTSPALHDPAYADIHTLHAQMVTQAQAIVERNIALLKDVVASFGKDLPDPAATRPTTPG